jgi:molecular chaperone GrpE
MRDDVRNKDFSEQESVDKTERTIETVPPETEMPAEKVDIAKETTSLQDDDLLSILKENHRMQQEIKDMIQSRLEYDAVKEKAFDKLYEEMRRQKEASDLLDRALKPVLSDLLLLYDSMKIFESSFINNQSLNSEDAMQDFKYIMDELMEILYRQEVTPIDENLSEVFNSKLQKATKTENAESKDDDFKIIDIVRRGFVWRDKVLRPQEVVIKRFLNKA